MMMLMHLLEPHTRPAKETVHMEGGSNPHTPSSSYLADRSRGAPCVCVCVLPLLWSLSSEGWNTLGQLLANGIPHECEVGLLVIEPERALHIGTATINLLEMLRSQSDMKRVELAVHSVGLAKHQRLLGQLCVSLYAINTLAGRERLCAAGRARRGGQGRRRGRAATAATQPRAPLGGAQHPGAPATHHGGV